MKLFNKEQYEQLLENGAHDNPNKHKFPLVKLYLPDSDFTCLLTELNPKFPHIGYGLYDIGNGSPKLGYVDLRALFDLQNDFRYAVETETLASPFFPISVYARAAYANREIVTNPNTLALFQIRTK